MMNPFLDRDAMRQLLAALTAACDDVRHGKGESPLLEELLRAHGGGLDLLGSYRVKVSAPKLPGSFPMVTAMRPTCAWSGSPCLLQATSSQRSGVSA